MIFLSDQDVAQLLDFAILYTSLKLRIPDSDILERDELLNRIATANPNVHKLLTDFLSSYFQWFEFHKEIERQGKQGRLSPAETQQLMTLTDRKDSTRARIVGKLRDIP